MNSETHRSAWWISLTGSQVKLQWSAGQLNIHTRRSVSKFSKNAFKKIRLCLHFSRGEEGGSVVGAVFGVRMF